MKSVINCILIILMFSYSGQQTVAPDIENEEEVDIDTTQIVSQIETKKTIIRDLHILHPAFRNKVILMLYECKKQGIELMVVETYRTPERQDVLKRRRLSTLSGGCSKHQHYLAIDVVPIINGRAIWHNRSLWNKIGEIGENEGLLWGGRWKKLRDFNHFEYNIHLDSIHTIPIPDKVIIPLNY